MRTPRQALADARIRVAQLERQLGEARIIAAEAEVEAMRAEIIERAPTTRPPAPDPDATAADELDGGWS